MAWKDLKNKFKRQFSDYLELPGDIMLDLPKIVLVGNQQVFIENHRGIQEYNPGLVRVVVSDKIIEVTGENLTLRNILPDEICVEGQITALTFLS
ncbi:sporulation protein YqfC [Desulfoscipio geothermicus]|uniref:Sporulation protein YqfC n=1 Tax=Desulfoscipio geothermicus DSM 3669 TaxID=1121426 RepID=A0A1I6D455_9FIRM|nr:sporulation protein YqfC [Desulfoscipio geothermicus]SFR00087.1 sporulation protein YqfC [Desulfoscipio geothermicus DSM 3669]